MDPLPKEQLLLKLLKMTTSDTDAECLVAIRKANRLLTESGWDWDKLIAGKIKIVPNPFAGLGNPLENKPAPAQPTYRAQPTPKPMAKFQGSPVRSLGTNRYADHCYCCGIEVMAGAGGFFERGDYNLNAASANPRSKFSVVCKSCEGNARIWDQPAAPMKKRGKASINDLA